VDGATFVKAELLAGGRDEKVRISWSSRPVPPLIEPFLVCCRSAYVTCLANAKRRANGVDKVLIYAVVSDPGRQISWRYCGAAGKGWRDKGRRRLILRRSRVRGNQKRQARDEAQHSPSGHCELGLYPRPEHAKGARPSASSALARNQRNACRCG
jgi:hypothetical protein